MEPDINVIFFEQGEMIFRLAYALLLGVLLGLERNFAQKIAGMRTYALVSLGAALFVVVSVIVTTQYEGITFFDPLRVASQIVVGVGFLGGGLIVIQGGGVANLTTAAGLWVAAAVGLASGFGLYGIAAWGTIFALFTFSILWYVEQKIKSVAGKVYAPRGSGDHNNRE